jgi:hypothetical protein
MLLRVALLAGAMCLACSPLHCEDKPVAPTGLPGVQGGYRIVRPAPPRPEPEDAAQADGKYGRWDLKISGKLTVDIGAGKLPPIH